MSSLCSVRCRAASPGHRAPSAPAPQRAPSSVAPGPASAARGCHWQGGHQSHLCWQGGTGRPRPCPWLPQGWGDGARLPKEGPWRLGLTNEPEGRLSHGGLRALQVGLAVPHKLFGPAAVLGQLQGAQGCGQYSEGPSLPDQPLLPAPPWLRALPHAEGRKGTWA